jgi:hypothetical protein
MIYTNNIYLGRILSTAHVPETEGSTPGVGITQHARQLE